MKIISSTYKCQNCDFTSIDLQEMIEHENHCYDTNTPEISILIDEKEYLIIPKEEDYLFILNKKHKTKNYLIMVKDTDNDIKWKLLYGNLDFKGYLNFKNTRKVKLINKKHKDVLDAYLNNIEVEGCIDDDWFCGKLIIDDFVETYNENFEYRIKK